ncbi:hypothetical protein PHMEG_00026607 [Phytophthora megakarya]|uniref:Uncharacterized protein n=1 Tax=Phytophthora megakarya TaxID=4795 RepID=A0A225V816_9STRA|nr:hypothetical protein PHMEG_00026607 [Phytophthora megakarya]
MDLQFIGNTYDASEYAAVYVSKAEANTVRFKKVIAGAVKRCDINWPHHTILKKVANESLSIREISAHEGYFILLRELPMHGTSRTVERIKVLRHHMRCYRLDTREPQELVELAYRASNTKGRLELLEPAYMTRPSNSIFDSMSYASFVEEYALIDTANSISADQDDAMRVNAGV